MATAAFKSTSKRSNANGGGGGDFPRKNPNPNPNPNPQKQRLRRSLSVNALNPTQIDDISSEFLNKRDNPLYWATGGSPPSDDVQTPTPGDGDGASESNAVAVGQRSRSFNRNSEAVIARRRRSLSRVNDNCGGRGRRGRSVSRPKLTSESDAEQESVISTTYRGRSSSIRVSGTAGEVSVSGGRSSDTRRSSHASRHPCLDSQVPNCEDGISTSSLSEAEEKTIKAVYEQMKSFQEHNSREDTASSEIYETVRCEVRRAIADIQYDLQHVMQRSNNGPLASTNVTDKPPGLVKPDAVELVLDIRREYAKKLEESQERARKLRSDLAVEEHRKQELARILKDTLPQPKPSSPHRPRFGRKSSSERKKMSKRLTDEAMSYFDECVSISTFDSSDFSAPEDLTVSTSVPQNSPGVSVSGPNDFNREQGVGGHPESGSSHNERVIDRVIDITNSNERERRFRFSFGHRPADGLDLRKYIKTFEKDGIASGKTTTNYSVDAYNQHDACESLLFDKFLFKNRQDSGSLHICGGVLVPFSPFPHLI